MKRRSEPLRSIRRTGRHPGHPPRPCHRLGRAAFTFSELGKDCTTDPHLSGLWCNEFARGYYVSDTGIGRPCEAPSRTCLNQSLASRSNPKGLRIRNDGPVEPQPDGFLRKVGKTTSCRKRQRECALSAVTGPGQQNGCAAVDIDDGSTVENETRWLVRKQVIIDVRFDAVERISQGWDRTSRAAWELQRPAPTNLPDLERRRRFRRVLGKSAQQAFKDGDGLRMGSANPDPFTQEDPGPTFHRGFSGLHDRSRGTLRVRTP